jgi:hypothetical protein
VDDSERQQLARAGVARAAGRLDVLEERLHALERLAFELHEIEERIDALERRAWLPSSEALQQERQAAITQLRSEGWSVSAISEATAVSRSRVAAIVRGLPTPTQVRGVNGSVYRARRAAARRRRTLDGGDLGGP